MDGGGADLELLHQSTKTIEHHLCSLQEEKSIANFTITSTLNLVHHKGVQVEIIKPSQRNVYVPVNHQPNNNELIWQQLNYKYNKGQHQQYPGEQYLDTERESGEIDEYEDCMARGELKLSRADIEMAMLDDLGDQEKNDNINNQRCESDITEYVVDGTKFQAWAPNQKKFVRKSPYFY